MDNKLSVYKFNYNLKLSLFKDFLIYNNLLGNLQIITP